MSIVVVKILYFRLYSMIDLETVFFLILKFSKGVPLDPPEVMNPHKMSSRLEGLLIRRKVEG